jgi:hypothetical protein
VPTVDATRPGGKGLAALPVRSGLVVARATDPDGEANEARLVRAVRPAVRARVTGPRLWLADRPFGDLTQTAAFTAVAGDHFLVRSHSKVHFGPDPTPPGQQGQDSQGRPDDQEWGGRGWEGTKKRRSVRRVTLHRVGAEDVIVVTDLGDAATYPAADLLALDLTRWGIERVFQQITAVFPWNRLMATTPQGTRFPLSLCLLLDHLIQVVRGSGAGGQRRAVETIATELLVIAVTKPLVAWNERGEVERVVERLPVATSAAAVRQRLGRLRGAVGSECWVKASPRKRKPPPPKKGKRDHTSIFRLLQTQRQIRELPKGP